MHLQLEVVLPSLTSWNFLLSHSLPAVRGSSLEPRPTHWLMYSPCCLERGLAPVRQIISIYSNDYLKENLVFLGSAPWLRQSPAPFQLRQGHTCSLGS